jgi:hypothetical protein
MKTTFKLICFDFHELQENIHSLNCFLHILEKICVVEITIVAR